MGLHPNQQNTINPFTGETVISMDELVKKDVLEIRELLKKATRKSQNLKQYHHLTFEQKELAYRTVEAEGDAFIALGDLLGTLS